MSIEDGKGRHGDSTTNEYIFLQVCDDGMSEWYGEVTWSEDRINDTDVKYIRAGKNN